MCIRDRGKVDELAVDFVAMEPKKTIYYQVAASVRDETTLKRELTPLQKITDHLSLIHILDDHRAISRVNSLPSLSPMGFHSSHTTLIGHSESSAAFSIA